MKRIVCMLALAALVPLGCVGAIAGAAAALSEPPRSGAVYGDIDPLTYAGPLVVATDEGDLVVAVRGGEAQAFLDRPDGSLASLSDEARAIVARSEAAPVDVAPCGVWLNAVASPFGYVESGDGCAVAGYPGYQRQYEWSNQSDVTICAQGRGWAPSVTWRSLGCGGGKTLVPWGNSIAYTKVKAISLSGVTGAAYRWLT